MIMEVKIVNLAQASAYIKYFGIQPLRVEVTDRLVFVFDNLKNQLWLSKKIIKSKTISEKSQSDLPLQKKSWRGHPERF